MQVLLSSIGFGLVAAAILSVSAVAFTMQFTVTNVFNLAFGAVMTVAGFVAYLANNAGVNIWIAMALAGGACGIMSLLLNVGVLAPFLRRGTGPFGMIIVTLAVGIIIGHLMQGITGPTFFSYTWNSGRTVHVVDMTFTVTQLATLGIAGIAMVSMHALLRYTHFGRSMRATASDRALARACGVRVAAVTNIAWIVSGVLAGVGAVLLFMDTGSFSVTTATDFLITVIAAAVLGGIGNAYGAMLGAAVVGIVTEVSAAYVNPSLKQIFAFALLVLVLLVRPRGIMSEAAAERGVAA